MASRCVNPIAYLKAALTDGPARNERPVSLPQADLPVLRPFVPGLLVSYVIDEGSSFSFIQNRDLSRDGISPEDLHTQAVEGLRQIARSRLRLVPQPGEIYAALLDGNFESSLLLLDGLWDKDLRHVIEHDFVVAIPARDILAFCDSESSQGMGALREVVDRVWPKGDHLITKNLYRRRNSVWEVIS